MEININKLTPELIGQVVAIQSFRRNKEEEGMIHADTLVKSVGILQGYVIDEYGKSVHIFYKHGQVDICLRTFVYEVHAKLIS